MFWGRAIILFLTIVSVLYGTADVYSFANYGETQRILASWAASGLDTMSEPARYTYAGRGKESTYEQKGLYSSDDN